MLGMSQNPKTQSTVIPQEYSLIFGRDTIAARVEAIGKEVSTWASQVLKETGKHILVLPVLRGSVVYYADLVRKVASPVEMAPVWVSSYDPESNTQRSGAPQIDLHQCNVQGRHLLLVDDICDSGKTLKYLTEELLKRGAVDIRTTCLILRTSSNKIFTPDWTGFAHTGEEWFVGYGMDDQNLYGNLPDVYVIKR